MTHNPTRRLVSLNAFLALLALVATFAADARAVTIATVPVGNAGNAGDPATDPADPFGYYGSVAYNYRIGTTEVSNAQYAEFLNAKAASDPFALYNPYMADASGPFGFDFGGITQSGLAAR